MELLRPTNDDDGEIGEFMMNVKSNSKEKEFTKKKKMFQGKGKRRWRESRICTGLIEAVMQLAGTKSIKPTCNLCDT